MLTLTNINVTFDQMTFDFNIKFTPNKIHAIIGRSGAGKSTLLNLIAGFCHPLSGDICWENGSILKLEPHLRPVTNLFQEHNLFAHLSVYDNIAIGLNPSLNLSKAQKQLVSVALKDIGLPHKANALPKDLSGGEAQRIALGRAFARAQDKAHARPILLLDEPFSALDPETRLEMRNIIKTIQQDHQIMVIIISHNPKEMLDFAHYISLVENGKIVATHCLSKNSHLPKEFDDFINI